MADNRLAKGIVLVPSLLLGGAFLSAAAWLDGPAAENRGLALSLGAVLLGAGVLAQFLPSGSPPPPPKNTLPEDEPTR
jgi:hypothetical protein